VLKLSAWEARLLHASNYRADVTINWLSGQSEENTFKILQIAKEQNPKKTLATLNLYHLPKNLWKTFLGDLSNQKLHTIPDKSLRTFAHKLHVDTYHLEGKTINKEEFVTCGGISLNEIDFKTMQSKKCPGLFFAGEILDIDGVTGGFNFQNAWTTGHIAGRRIGLCY
jgi:predicted Rossmann fold flavoprotein